VASETQYHVVILYEHPLLGEGIAKYLRTRAGVEATVASAGDSQAVTSALALEPAVVIFELSDPIRQVGLAAMAPHAVLIDVSTVITRGSVISPGVGGLEQILQAVDHSIVARPA
jgi:DNA-binding NarL/FixJ family response regulator